MRTKFAVLLTVALSLGVVQAATAADMPVKAPAATATPSWTGFYAGVSLGGRWSDATWTTSSIVGPPVAFAPPDPTNAVVDYDSSTVRIGGYLGYNWQFAPRWLAGLEGDLAWGNSKNTRGGVPGTFGTGQYTGPGVTAVDSTFVKETWDASLRARLGFLLTPTWLLYAIGGVAFQDLEVGASCGGHPPSWCNNTVARSESVSSVRVGWTIGGGVETMLSKNWLARVEYRYADYGSIVHTFFPAPPTGDAVVSSVSLRTHTVLGGISYNFN